MTIPLILSVGIFSSNVNNILHIWPFHITFFAKKKNSFNECHHSTNSFTLVKLTTLKFAYDHTVMVVKMRVLLSDTC